MFATSSAIPTRPERDKQKTKVRGKVIVDRSKEFMGSANVRQRVTRRGVQTFVYLNRHNAGFAPVTVGRFQKSCRTAG